MFALAGVYTGNIIYVTFGLTISLIFITAFLVISSSRIEEYQRRLSDMRKIELGVNITLKFDYKLEKFIDVPSLTKRLDKLSKDTSYGVNFNIDETNKILNINFIWNLEESVKKVLQEFTEDEDLLSKIEKDMSSYKNL